MIWEFKYLYNGQNKENSEKLFFQLSYFPPILLLKKLQNSKNEKIRRMKKLDQTEIRTFCSDDFLKICLP